MYVMFVRGVALLQPDLVFAIIPVMSTHLHKVLITAEIAKAAVTFK